MRWSFAATFVIVGSWTGTAFAVDADPTNYQSVVPRLKPGDTLNLASGSYTHGLVISGLNGSDAAWITITGPASGPPAVIEAPTSGCCNTVEIINSSYVVLRNVTVDGKSVDGAFGISAKDGSSNAVHHITVEDCTIVNVGTSQQDVGISTKTPTWGWVIRRNRILGAGTGMYLGNSNGADPFVAGLIEYNLIQDPIGYCMQIKWQLPRPSVTGMPTGDSSTIIRHNVFIKNDQPSPDGDRPNLLVGGFPDSGPGISDLYEIYGNFFYHNPHESLMQASGRVSIHDNIFVDGSGAAILLQNHDLPLKLAHVYNNTIYATATGISFGSAAPQGDLVTGNLVFSDNPIAGTITHQIENMTQPVASAASMVVSPSTTLGSMDFYPLPGKCQKSPPIDLTSVSSQDDYDRDFNGTSKGSFLFRGAYAGEGVNPGWKLGAGIKTMGSGGAAGSGGAGGGGGAGAGGSGGAGGGSAGDAGGLGGAGGQDAGAGADTGAPSASSSDSGCGCRTSAAADMRLWWMLAALGVMGMRSRRKPPLGPPPSQ